MKFQTVPDTPRHLGRCGAMVAPGQDARWRGVPAQPKKLAHHIQRVNSTAVLDVQRKAR